MFFTLSTQCVSRTSREEGHRVDLWALAVPVNAPDPHTQFYAIALLLFPALLVLDHLALEGARR